MSASLANNTQPSPVVRTTGSRLRAVGAIIGEPAWVMFCMFGLAVVVVAIVMRLFPSLIEAAETTVGQLVANVTIYALGVLFVLLPLIVRKKGKGIAALLGLDRAPTLAGLVWALSAFAIYFWVTIVVGILMSFVPGFDAEQAQDVGFEDVTTTAEYLMAFIGLVVLPPIFEEVLFRGYLFGRLRRHVGFWVTTIVTSVAFGLVHGQWNVGVDTFVLSIFLCFLREYTGSLWAPMLLHAFKNGLAYFFLFVAPLIGLNLL